MSTSAPTAEQLLALVAGKATVDPAFGKELLANPKAAVEKLFGQALPAHITLQAVAQPVGTYVIPVPTTTVVGAGGELSDSDLEAVAGGSKSGANDFFNEIGDAAVSTGNDLAQAGVIIGNVGSVVGSAVLKDGVSIGTGGRANIGNVC